MKAAGLLRRLVNEGYNAVVNAQLLSKYYVAAYIDGDASSAAGYQYLEKRMDDRYLYPFPDQKLLGNGNHEALVDIQNTFLANQKEILTQKFSIVIEKFKNKYEILFNKCIPVPEGKKYSDNYFDGSTNSYAARKENSNELRNSKSLRAYTEELQDCNYPYNYLTVLNDMLNGAYRLNCVLGHESELLKLLCDAVIGQRQDLLEFRRLIEEEDVELETYNKMLEVSFDTYAGAFFEKLVKYSIDYISLKKDIVDMNEGETNLREFCIEQGFDTPEVLFDTSDDLVDVPDLQKQYLGFELIDDGVTTASTDDRYDEISRILVSYRAKLTNENAKLFFLMRNQQEFEKYFTQNINGIDRHKLQRKTVAILDDKGDSDNDLLFTTDGLVQIVKGKYKEPVPYDDIQVLAENSGLMLHQSYENKDLDMNELIEAIKALRENPVMQVYESKNPMDFIFGWFR